MKGSLVASSTEKKVADGEEIRTTCVVEKGKVENEVGFWCIEI